MPFLNREELIKLYSSGLSMSDIAIKQNASIHKIVYWMEKYGITRRTRSEAAYIKKHPNGDPFKFSPPTSLETAKLFGLGIGLYWGEGTKANKTSVRLGNTDPKLINMFMVFLIKIFNVNKKDLRFGLQIFTDLNPSEVIDYWINQLKIKKEQFYKTIVTKSGSLGTYRKKCEYGVLTVHYHNKKLRDLLVEMILKNNTS